VAGEAPRKVTRYEIDGENLPRGHAHVTAQGGAIRFDGSAATDEMLPGPADLLAAALAACILKNVERFSKLLRFTYRRATVHVAVEREDPPPRIVRARYTLRVETDEPESRLVLMLLERHPHIRGVYCWIMGQEDPAAWKVLRKRLL